MTKYIVSIFLSIVVAYYFTEKLISRPIISKVETTLCSQAIPITQSNKATFSVAPAVQKQKRIERLSLNCLKGVANKGDSFQQSQKISESHVYDLFSKELEDNYNRLNEPNVVTNKDDFGSSAQKFDPRDGVHIRFPISPEEEMKELPNSFFLTEKEYKKKVEEKKCPAPQFKKVIDTKNITKLRGLLKENKGYSQADKPNYVMADDNREGIIIFGGNNSYRGVMFGDKEKTLYYRNLCNGGFNTFRNICTLDSNYDMQYQDIFYLIDKDLIMMTTYCKKSNQKSWPIRVGSKLLPN
jgi:hypothetical protein